MLSQGHFPDFTLLHPDYGIVLNAIIPRVGNGASESINSRINMIKIRSRGFRNKARYKNAIYFHLGGLDLYPEGVVCVFRRR